MGLGSREFATTAIFNSHEVGYLPKAYIFYHFLYPDDVVSSIHFSELCSGLAKYGWNVTAFPCTRGCRKESNEYSRYEVWDGVRIERIWRPAWRQSSGAGRLLNAAWMIISWTLLAIRSSEKPDLIVIGTDPILSILVAPFWRIFSPKTKIVHWCFDLYPEAAYADGILNRYSLTSLILHRLLKRAYRACDLVVDIGECMRNLLLKYDGSLTTATLVPWALIEPEKTLPIAQAERESLFGQVRLVLMYSGSFGRAHSYEDILKLARLLRNDDVHLAFSVRGNRENALRTAVQADDSNIHFVPFAAADQLRDRLACADIHIVSLRDEWTGTVVPSKFFGAIAAGRPVLFCGSKQSAIAKWIEHHEIGWVLTDGNVPIVADILRSIMSNPIAMQEMCTRCHQVYQQYFSRNAVLEHWRIEISRLFNTSRCS
jgi:colanic acid biosynthesis glycosyl transferase WcaI